MLRVIIADDHPIVRIGQKVVIEASGKCKVVGEASGPDDLLVLLSTTPCDVLVTDFAMPGGRQADGYALLSLLQRQYPLMPVILVTMFANIATLRASFAQGARHCRQERLGQGVALGHPGSDQRPDVCQRMFACAVERGRHRRLVANPAVVRQGTGSGAHARQRHDRQPDCGTGQSQYFHDQQTEKYSHEPAVYFYGCGLVRVCALSRNGAVENPVYAGGLISNARAGIRITCI